MHFKMVGRLGALLGIAALVLVMGASSAAAQDGPMVDITDGQSIDAYAFTPPTMAVNVGDTVTWTNDGSMAHTVTASDGSFDSGNVNPGETFSITFTDPGTINYQCTPHPWMKGTITVG